MTAIGDPRFRLLCLAFLLLLSTFFLPAIAVRRVAYSVVAVLDITGSMNTRDQNVAGRAISRLDMEKRALQGLLTALPCGSKLGVAIFVEERPFLLVAPVETCENFAPLMQSIGGIDWKMGWDSESHIAGGLLAAMDLALGQDADLLFMTDGQEMPPLAWSTAPDFTTLRGRVDGLIVGVGGTQLVPIPKFDKAGKEIGVWKPGELPSETGGMFKGHEYLTAVDEPHLRALSAQTSLAYLHLLHADDITNAGPPHFSPRLVSGVLDLRWAPAGLALLLLASANLTMVTRWRRPRFLHLGRKALRQQVNPGDRE
jgi:mxaL protein